MMEGKKVFLHIGDDRLINIKELVMIIDLDRARQSSITKEFIECARLDKILDNEFTDKDQAKSMVITTDQVLYSPITAATLVKRFQK